MPDRSFGLVAVSRAGRTLTGPMMLAGLILAAVAFTRLSGLDHAGVSFCYFKTMTGHACFTCGTTRALGYLARLDWRSAFAIQPLVTASTILLLIWGGIDTILLLVGKRTLVRLEDRALRRVLASGVALATLNWIYLLATGV